MFLKIMLKHIKKNKTSKRVETRVKLTLTFWDNEKYIFTELLTVR